MSVLPSPSCVLGACPQHCNHPQFVRRAPRRVTPSGHQGFVYAGCSRAVNQFVPDATVGIAHCNVPVHIASSVRPQTGRERDSGERRTREPL